MGAAPITDLQPATPQRRHTDTPATHPHLTLVPDTAPSATTLESILTNALASLDHVDGILLASTSGMILAEHFVAQSESSEALGAMVASSQQIAARISELVWNGTFEEITLRSSDGYLMLYSVGDNAVLAVLARKAVRIARVHLDAADLRPQLANIINAT